MAPRGLASAVGMFAVSRLINRLGAPRLVLAGLVLAAGGTWLMTWYSLDLSIGWFIWPSLLQGLGMGMIFVPLSTLVYETLPRSATDQGSAIFNLARTVGSAVGISLAATVLTHMTQVNWNRLGGDINPFNPVVQQWLAAQKLDLSDSLAPQLLAHELGRQASMVGFLDAFWFVTLSFVVLAPLLLLFRRRVSVAGTGKPSLH